ncbi:hypothetical protein [Okeania sp. SIO2B3]|uniref:hypothetical protein n=1 Tax=Okeania sp. SIO2B3 TaxID=2607784 RepID=UPI0013C03567|nr:hypothetical protein [Okeania sp. SIO2B3]NET46721.1 hypothetical protein [Okeania sp. SIO2B3]
MSILPYIVISPDFFHSPTPSNLWLSNISLEVGNNIPFVGRGIFYTLINDIRNVLVLVAAFKIFKSLSRF